MLFSTMIQKKSMYKKKYYQIFALAKKNFFKCLHLFISSDFLFRRYLLLINLIIYSFSVKHDLQIIGLGFPCTFNAIEYLMVKLMLLRFNCQIYLGNFVLFSNISGLNSLLWILYLSLKVVSDKTK